MKKINESFICINCGKKISQAEKTCRNHCPYCFVSLHVDGDIPGDRDTDCGGKMYPTTYETRNGVLKILFKCSKCFKQHRNKRSPEDEITQLNNFIDLYQSKF
ncbi:RNHCP domain-containing protein [Candidatus Gracilibacteria bacterium]|nr:RNHCP domain-containing protein [Candidatus Gracilibacteria bacterium]